MTMAIQLLLSSGTRSTKRMAPSKTWTELLESKVSTKFSVIPHEARKLSPKWVLPLQGLEKETESWITGFKDGTQTSNEWDYCTRKINQYCSQYTRLAVSVDKAHEHHIGEVLHLAAYW